MNLREFMDFRKKCPMCGGLLITFFHSNRKQIIRYKDEQVSFIFKLDTLNKRQKSYQVAYAFGVTDYQFTIEFYKKSGEHYYTESPNFLRKRFKELHVNLAKNFFKFYRECVNPSCAQYSYNTSYFEIDFKTATYGPLEIGRENITLIYPLPGESDKCRVYRLNNYLPGKKTLLQFWKGVPEEANLNWNIPSEAAALELPLIPFVSKEETLKRLNNLIIFM
jgi:hypothetical protein